LVLFGCVPLTATNAPDRAAPAATPDATWRSGAERSIAASEYRASANAHGLQAPNRAHGLRTYFEPRGIRVHDRGGRDPQQLLSLRLVAFGRSELRREVPAGEVSHDGARVEIRRAGLREWYLNSEAGLEQGFTLATRPEGDGELWLELAVAGASVAGRGDALELHSETGRRLRYGELHARDAAGREISARLEPRGAHALRLVVDDDGAVYPLVIDPLLTAASDALLQSDQQGAYFGLSVASAGDVNGDGFGDVIAGAPEYDAGDPDEGAAFVFLGSPAGIASASVASAHATLQSNRGSALLGWSVASAGDVNGDGFDDVIVGALNYAVGDPINGRGAAFVFLGGANGIQGTDPATAHARLESAGIDTELGTSVASAGDVNGDGYADVIVGARAYASEESQTLEGAAFVFLGSASGIASGDLTTAGARIESDQLGAFLGWSVASAGDVNGDGYADVIAGAPYYESEPGQDFEGVALVFLGSPTGIASGNPASAHAAIESDAISAELGYSVASAGDVNGDGYADLIVGAPYYDAPQTDEGAGFVFLGGASGITASSIADAHAVIESDESDSWAGASVASAGDVNGDGYADVLIGGPFYGTEDGGGVAVLLGSASGIVLEGDDTFLPVLSGGASGDMFGTSVAAAGDVNGDGYGDVIVGAPDFDSGGQDQEGAALVYLGSAVGLTLSPDRIATARSRLESDQASARLGFAVASAGDIDADGYDDVIVGAPYYDSGAGDTGAAFVFHGGASGIGDGDPLSARTRLLGDQPDAWLGRSVASAGDVNGDGYGDVIVGAPRYDSGQSDEGAAFLFLGGAAGIPHGTPATAEARLESDQPDAQLGLAVASAGDVNGDGLGDLIVGSPRYDAGQSDEGAAFVFLGAGGGVASTTAATAHARIESDQASAELGESVASAGDVNGDGYGDVIVASAYYDGGLGAALVSLGSASGIPNANPTTAHARLQSDQAGSLFGWSAASAGDVNGDGYGDVIVGSVGYSGLVSLGGAAFLFLGGASGIPSETTATADATLESDQPNTSFGWSVASAGDVNGDGYGDVIVGSVGYEASIGAAFVFYGSGAGIADATPLTADASFRPFAPTGHFGWSVAPAGDVNGDGFSDLIVGAPSSSFDETNEGAAFLFPGNRGVSGRPVLPRQRAGGALEVNVSPWGASRSVGDFRVRMQATHPAGRGRARLEIETCPAGARFGSPACLVTTSAAWADVGIGAGGATLTQSVSGLLPNVLYRWRARVQHAPVGVTAPGVTPPPKPAHGPWRRLDAQRFEGDVRIGPDRDLDGIADAADNCPTIANGDQLNFDGDANGDACDRCETIADAGVDSDGDSVDDACDTCTSLANAPLAGSPAANRTYVSHQRDDDADGRGNRCDFDYDQAGAVVVSADFNHMKASVGELVSTSGCGTANDQRCGEFDHDGAGLAIASTDFNLTKAAVGKVISSAFPKCAACTQGTGWSGVLGPEARLGRPICQSAIAGACVYAP
jgi:hypothetical protein